MDLVLLQYLHDFMVLVVEDSTDLGVGESPVDAKVLQGARGDAQQFPDLTSTHSLMDLMELLDVLVRTGKQGQEAQQEQYSRCTGHNGHATRGS